MKKSLFVTVALSVFTVTSFTASAQFRINLIKDLQYSAEGIVYNPVSALQAAKKVNNFTFSMATELCSSLQFKYAQLLNREVESLTNFSLFGFIEDWWGTRYRYGGTSKKGVDCSSFTGQLINSVFGISLPRTAREQFAACERLTESEMTEGDLIFFNTRGGVSHVGVFLGGGFFVHSSCSNGVTISSLDDSYYRKRFIAGGRPVISGADCVARNYTSPIQATVN